MTSLDAAKILEVPVDASPEQLEARFLDLRRKLEDKIAKAPTPGLQAKYRETLAQITIAFETLTLAADSSTLPVLHKQGTEDGRPTTAGGPADAGPSLGDGRSPRAGSVPSSQPPKPSPRKAAGGGREFIIVALLAVTVLGGGVWWIMAQRAEKAAAAAETQRQQQAAEADAAEQAKVATQLRTQLATAKVTWDAFENRLREAERQTAEAKSELRSFRDGPAWKKAELSSLARRHEVFTSLLNELLVSHPAKIHRVTAEQLLSEKLVDEAAGEVAEMQYSIEQLQGTLRDYVRFVLEITTTVEIKSQPAGVKFLFTDAYGRVTEGVTPAAFNDQPLSHLDNPKYWADAAPRDSEKLGEFTVMPAVRFARPGWEDVIDTHPIEFHGDTPNEFRATFPEGGLKVQSVPAGVPFVAANTLGWEVTGKTPATLEHVPPGTVQVRLTRKGYADVVQKVAVVAKATATTSLLDQRTQTVTIAVAEAKSKIFVDGKFAGYEKVVLNDLTATEHQLQIEAPNYIPYRTKFPVKQENTRASLSFRFSDLAARNIACTQCSGNGYKTHRRGCRTCGADGWVRCSNCNGNGTVPFLNSYITCNQCNRSGQVPCSDCQQTGVIDDQEHCNHCSGRGYFSKLDLQ